MLGKPALGLECMRCGGSGARRDGLCLSCWGQGRRKYVFNEDLIGELRRAYAGRNKQAIGEGLDRLVRLTGWPRWAFTSEAQRRGWTTEFRRSWQDWEVELLQEKLGEWTAKALARRLRRSVASVEAKAEALRISRRRSRGYNLGEIRAVLGISHSRASRLLERGLLGKVHRTSHEVWVTEENMVAFLRRHSGEYDLRRVDQAWFKATLLKGGA